MRWMGWGALAGLALGSAALAGTDEWTPRRLALERYTEATEAMAAGDGALAEVLLAEALAADPGCGLCQHALAVHYLTQDQPEDAWTLLLDLARAHPEREEVLTLQAMAALATQRWDDAYALSQRAISKAPDSFLARQVEMQVLMRQGRYDDARLALLVDEKHLDAVEVACLEMDLALGQGDALNARSWWERCQRLPDPRMRSGLQARLAALEGDLAPLRALAAKEDQQSLEAKLSAIERYNAGDYAGAADLLGPTLQQNPGDAEARVMRARCALALGQAERARADLEALLQSAPFVRVSAQGAWSGALTAADAARYAALRAEGLALYAQLLVKGDLAAAQGVWGEPPAETRAALAAAAATLAAAAAQSPPSAPLAAAEIRLLQAQGERTAAWDKLTAARATWPDAAELHWAAISLITEDEDALLAEKRYLLEETRAWLRAQPDPRLALALATASARRERYSDCRDLLAPLVAQRPVPLGAAPLAHLCAVGAGDLAAAKLLLPLAGGAADPSATLRQAWLSLQAGRPDDALAALQGLTLTDPAQIQQERELRVAALTAQGKLRDAEAALAAGPIAPQAQANLALALYQSGQVDRARRMLSGACGQMKGDEAKRCQQAAGKM